MFIFVFGLFILWLWADYKINDQSYKQCLKDGKIRFDTFFKDFLLHLIIYLSFALIACIFKIFDW